MLTHKRPWSSSCRAESQKSLDRTDALLHSPAIRESAKAFTTLPRTDPNCVTVSRGTTSSKQLQALDYLVYAYLQVGQSQEARHILGKLDAIQEVNVEDLKVAYALAAMPVRYALERGRWAYAASPTPHPSAFAWSRFP